MELNSSLPVYTTTYKLIALSLVFSAIVSFPQFLKRETDKIASYHVPYNIVAPGYSAAYCS